MKSVAKTDDASLLRSSSERKRANGEPVRFTLAEALSCIAALAGVLAVLRYERSVSLMLLLAVTLLVIALRRTGGRQPQQSSLHFLALGWLVCSVDVVLKAYDCFSMLGPTLRSSDLRLCLAVPAALRFGIAIALSMPTAARWRSLATVLPLGSHLALASMLIGLLDAFILMALLEHLAGFDWVYITPGYR